MLIGYCRTSTTDQQAGLAAHERDLLATGVEKVFAEQVSSVAPSAALKACLEFIREGDVLVVTKPDRLARSTAELLTIEATLSGALWTRPGWCDALISVRRCGQKRYSRRLHVSYLDG
jgi:DNA invertase Pin-like site-specific DNA recombinase